ncbi:MAG: methyltransferase domain-containing protein [Actinomycetes bacterium]
MGERARMGLVLVMLYGICVGDDERFAKRTARSLRNAGVPEDRIITRRDQSSIFHAYNSVLSQVRDMPDLTGLVLVHEDVTVDVAQLEATLSPLLADPSVGIVGAVGARRIPSLAWWDGEPAGRCQETRGLVEYGFADPDVDVVDGLLMALSPWAVRTLEFDERTFSGFHGYDADLCLQARHHGKRVVVAELDLFHHTTGGYGDKAAFDRSDAALRRKWSSYFRTSPSVGGPAAASQPDAEHASRYHHPQDMSGENAHARCVALIPPGSTVLDLGCATGLISEQLVARGCTVVGVEIDPVAASHARRWCTHVEVADLETVDLARVLHRWGPFDVVLAADILEHLVEPGAVLARARKLLAPHGMLVTSVPNVAHSSVRMALLQGRFPYTPTGLLDSTHLRFFTAESMVAMLSSGGFTPQQIHRVRLPLERSELIASGLVRLDPELIPVVTRAPDHDTYQFVTVSHAAERTATAPAASEAPGRSLAPSSVPGYVSSTDHSSAARRARPAHVLLRLDPERIATGATMISVLLGQMGGDDRLDVAVAGLPCATADAEASVRELLTTLSGGQLTVPIRVLPGDTQRSQIGADLELECGDDPWLDAQRITGLLAHLGPSREPEAQPTAAVHSSVHAGTPPEVTIVVPTLDASSSRARTLLASIRRQVCVPHEVVLVDNGGAPQGFSAPVNAGIRAAQGRYLVVCNDDVDVLEGWWAPLREALDSGATVVYPRTEGGVNRDDFAAWCFAFKASDLDRLSFAPGEFFDPSLTVWYQDTDLLVRLRAMSCAPRRVEVSRIRHELSATVNSPDPVLSAWVAKQVVADRERFESRHGMAVPGAAAW